MTQPQAVVSQLEFATIVLRIYNDGLSSYGSRGLRWLLPHLVTRGVGMSLNRRYLLLGIDLVWVALSAFAALYIRDNFAPREEAVEAAVLYACVCVGVAAVTFPVAGLNRTLWRYTSLGELMRLLLTITVTLLLALLAMFALTRLSDVSRSLPLLQWAFLAATMTATRLAIRVYSERRALAREQFVPGNHTKHVLIVGVNSLAEVFVRAMGDFAARDSSIVGFLASETQMSGRLLRSCKVLGTPEDLPKVIRELQVHGTWLDRVVVAEDLSRLSKPAQQALLEFERSSQVEVMWLSELLGFCPSGERTLSSIDAEQTPGDGGPTLSAPSRLYRYPKRILDLFAATFLLILIAPLLAAISLLVAIDVGLPVVFWQNRPGRFGRHFKLYKFRTMRAPHDDEGNVVPDDHRISRFGKLLRLSRLDELPQLYNILVGEMSFVGPRPLVLTDHEPGTHDRLLVRPGLTGWAQVNGGRKLSQEEKAVLDIWYVAHLSLALDLKIALHTFLLLFTGECVNGEAVRAARKALLLERRVAPLEVPRQTSITTAARSAA